MKKLSKGMLMAALICGSIVPVLCGGTSVYAAEADAADEALSAFELNPMIITATRTEKKDLDIPASTEVLTHEQIKMSGATNALEAVQKMNGVEMKQMFPGGAAMTSMIPEINIRGFGNGTLVMVNGNPINLNTKYFIDSIPTEYIEKIEVVKGGGTVLYGSEAMGGVVNIITKKKFDNYATIGIGNYHQRKYALGVGNDKFHVNYDEKRWGRMEHVTDSHNPASTSGYYYNQDRNVKRNIGVGINITKELDFQFNHFETYMDYDRNKQITDAFQQWRKTYTKQNLFQLNYNAKDWKGHIWYHNNKINYYGGTKPGVTTGSTLTENLYSSLGMDIQKDFHVNEKTLITAGMDFKREEFKPKFSDGKSTSAAGLENHNRNILSAYAQVDHKFTKKDNLIVGGRGTWVTSDKNGNKYHDFSASGQYLHKFDDNQSAYVSVTQSFIMPSWSQMFPSGLMAGEPNPNLKPQKGINYEIGYKAVAGNHSYKLALFHMKVHDNITATWKNQIYTYKNEDFRNTGFEASMNVVANDRLDYNVGLTIQNPKNKADVKTKVGWQRKFGAYQLTAGANYKLNKFKFGLKGSYVWDRYSSPSSSDSYKIKPYFLTTLTTVYTPDKHSEFALIVDNVLHRKDFLSNTMGNYGTYYSTPTNFLFTYTYKF